MGGLLDRLAHAPDSVLAIVALIALYALYQGFAGLIRARRIEDVPTARVRSAHQGYVELVGTAHSLDGEPIVAPLSNTLCCWYSYRVERSHGNNWRAVDSGTSDGIFTLRDPTGECIIDPEGAEVTTRHRRRWSGDGGFADGHGVHARLAPLGGTADVVVKLGGKVFGAMGSGSYRYTERVILDGDPLYAIGQFHSLGNADRGVSIKDLTGAILRDWKRRPDTLLARFDTDRDGVLDVGEWDGARAVAEREAVQQVGHQQQCSLHTLRRPTDRRHFLLSNLEEFGLLRRYRWRMWYGLVGFILLSTLCAWMLSTRL